MNKTRSFLFCMVMVCVFLSGCAAGLKNLTVDEQARKFGSDAMTEYTKWYNESNKLLADDTVPTKEKVFIATKINPVLNKCYELIVKYNEAVLSGESPDRAEINRLLIVEIPALFVQKGGT